MKRFSIGDIARVKYVRSGRSEFWHEGAIVEIIEVSNNVDNIIDYDGGDDVYDYIVRMINGGRAFPIDSQLEPFGEEQMSIRKEKINEFI